MASSPPPCWTGGNPISNNVEDYVFFLSKDATPYGCFSNAFRERDDGHLGLRSGDGPFWCVNQELHYRKAVLFDDEEVASLILAERKDASKIKQHGRMVKRYDDKEWVKNRYDIAREAIESKFLSDETLKKILLDTEGKIIVEAATDRVGCKCGRVFYYRGEGGKEEGWFLGCAPKTLGWTEYIGKVFNGCERQITERLTLGLESK